MGALIQKNPFVDVICQYTTKGDIIPLRIRIQDEDGVYQTFVIKAYKDLSATSSTLSPYGTKVHSPNWNFECKVQVFNMTHIINLFFNPKDCLWKITRMQ